MRLLVVTFSFSRRINFSAGSRWQKGFSGRLDKSALIGIYGVTLVLTRTLVKHCKFFALRCLGLLSHITPSKLLGKIIIFVLLVNFGGYLFPMLINADDDDVWCPDNYAIGLKSGEPFAGKYIACENFNEFWVLIEKKDLKRAELLTFGVYPDTKGVKK